MSVEKYGIYIAFPPTIDIRSEGLGRYLAAFLKASQNTKDVDFIIGCPNWSREALMTLCRGEGIDFSRLEFLSPRGLPAILRLFRVLDNCKIESLKKVLRPVIRRFRKSRERVTVKTPPLWFKWLVSSSGFTAFILLSFFSVLAAPFVALFLAVSFLTGSISLVYKSIKPRLGRFMLPARFVNKLSHILRNLKNYDIIIYLYAIIAEDQANRLVRLANKRKDILAWYATTAFWPEFNGITAPKLMCVPDVVLRDFPVGFSNVGGNRFADTYRKICEAIHSADYLVTYSEHIKWNNVIKYYDKEPSSVFVVPHAPNTLCQWLPAFKADVPIIARQAECKKFLASALKKALDKTYTDGITSTDFKYIFYASQIRPNKNVLTLLRAYEFLLRQKFIPHKLVLTGNIYGLPCVADFIQQHGLMKEVLCLHGLSTSELAACYALADLAVNPSLSEGGCPFTFTEALSVETPVVMSRIPVALEVLTDESLQDTMFFDPYNWKDMAARIAWGLENRDDLLALQRPVYRRLAQRCWCDVVGEHIDILRHIGRRE